MYNAETWKDRSQDKRKAKVMDKVGPLRALSFTTPERTIGRQPPVQELAISCTFFGVYKMVFLHQHISPIWWRGSHISIVFQWAIWSSVSSRKGCLSTYIWVSLSALLAGTTVLTFHHLLSLDEHDQWENPDLWVREFLSKLLLSDKRQAPQWKLNFRQITGFQCYVTNINSFVFIWS